MLKSSKRILTKILPEVAIFGLTIILGLWLASRLNPAIEFPYYYSDLATHYSRRLATFAHFDGIHYLRIAHNGYLDAGGQAFFPLYPLALSALSSLGFDPLISGLMISGGSLIMIIWGLYKLYEGQVRLPLTLLLFFPTSFFLFALYTESLFVALVIWFFYFLQKKQYLTASTLAALASATRFVGVFLALSLLIELVTKRVSLSHIIYLLIAPIGLLLYMLYLQLSFGDPLLFLHVQPLFGAERSGSSMILLPRVLYRYTQMLLTVPAGSFVYERIVLELVSLIYGLYLLIKSYSRVPLTVTVFSACAILVPTLSGTLSSLPRYLLPVVPLLAHSVNSKYRLSYFLISWSLLLYLFIRFALGYFVS